MSLLEFINLIRQTKVWVSISLGIWILNLK